MPTTQAEIEAASIIHVAQIGSTNEEGLTRARRGDTGPLWIQADRQTTGRGRQGRKWDSPTGNLHVSLLVPVAAQSVHLPQLAHVAVVALVRAIRATLKRAVDLRIKWPNDLLVGDAKVAGILVEATNTPDHGQACVIGWGVNCSHHPDGLAYPATHLSAVVGQAVSAGDLLGHLVPAMAESFTVWDNGKGFEAIRSRWLADALPFDTSLTVRTGQQPVTGRFQGIDQNGRLLLLGPWGPVTVEAGDIILNERSAAYAG